MVEKKKDLNTKIAGSLAWKLTELAGAQGIQFVVALVLARLMSPEDYGAIGLILIFITVANTFVQSGFATALIQKQQIEQEDYSSVFYVTILLSAAVYLLLYLSAPAIAAYYQMDVLSPLLRVMGTILLPGAIISIQTAYVARNMDFKRLFCSTIAAVILSGIVSVVMAYLGLGVWAMAAQQMIYYVVLMCSLLILVEWRPTREFSVIRLKGLFDFGWKILVSGLIDTVWTNIYGLIIGKRYSSAELGGYNRGEQFPKLIAANLSSAIQAVMFPAFSRQQSDRESVKAMMKQSIRMSAMAVFPMMAGLMAASRALVVVLLTDKWLFCVPYMCMMCLAYAMWPIHVTNLQVINAMGKSDLFLRLEIIKKTIGVLMLLISLRYGVLVILAFKVVNEFLCTLINAWPNKKILNYGVLEQYRDMAPAAISAGLMGVIVWGVGRVGLPPVIILFVQILSGVASYVVISAVINRESCMYLVSVLKKIYKGKQG